MDSAGNVCWSTYIPVNLLRSLFVEETFRLFSLHLMIQTGFEIAFKQTNSYNNKTEQQQQLLLPPVFFIDDFSFVAKKLRLVANEHRDFDNNSSNKDPKHEVVETLVVEELIMPRSDVHIPAFPLSITEQTLCPRLAHNNKSSERDQNLLDVYTTRSALRFIK